jgi:hypothetical protein
LHGRQIANRAIQQLIDDIADQAGRPKLGQFPADQPCQRIGPVVAGANGGAICLGQIGVGGRIGGTRPKMRHQRLTEGDGEPQRPAARGRRLSLQHQRLSREAACGQDEMPPLAARFPPSVITGIVAEAVKDRERDADQRLGAGRMPV